MDERRYDRAAQVQVGEMAIRIEICGGIASGKTTFASLFEERAKIIYEDFQAVPFWQDFYAAPKEHAFETELSFLLQHYHQVKRAQSESHTLIVCDFSLALDAAYAYVSLNPGDLKAFSEVLEQVRKHLGPPQLLIAINCPPQIEMSRIRARGRAAESQIDLSFLEQLNRALETELRRLAQSVQTLEVDSANEDFAHDQEVKNRWLEIVLSRVSEMRHLQRGSQSLGSSLG